MMPDEATPSPNNEGQRRSINQFRDKDKDSHQQKEKDLPERSGSLIILVLLVGHLR
jgi:hypothetical protein